MKMLPAIANVLWTASNLPAYWRFRRALRNPQLAQRAILRALLTRNACTAFGKAHGFDKIRIYGEFARRVPLSDYGELESWISRIQLGEQNVLTRDRVTHLVPTSGSTGARKLIPFTPSLQREFNAGIAPWLADLVRQFPRLIGGPAYWAITPVLKQSAPVETAQCCDGRGFSPSPPLEERAGERRRRCSDRGRPHGEAGAEVSSISIGFDADTAYLAGWRRTLADAIMAVPPSAGRAESLETFRYETLLHLLRCRELRLISVWHPSFLTLLLDALPGLWEQLIEDIRDGVSVAAQPKRADELEHADPLKPETLWPKLQLISCWGDGAAALSLDSLKARFPSVPIQLKGLVATEAFVTLPFAGRYPLSVASHFFEFIDSSGKVLPAESLRIGDEYEVVVTTSGGLWRYRLGDRVLVTDRLERTPSLRFIGRGEAVSDVCGEKLSEIFVSDVLKEIFADATPAFALLAPDHGDGEQHYTLYVEGEPLSCWTEALDRGLRRNPHYDYCRDLGQLSAPRLFVIAGSAFEAYALRKASNGARLCDIKPAALSRSTGWSEIFEGTYFDQTPSTIDMPG